MAKSISSKIRYGVVAALGAAAAVIPLYVYHFVEAVGMHHGTAMECEAACIAATAAGGATAAAAITGLFLRGGKANVAASSVLLAGGVATAAVPQFIGFCASEHMACRYITAPTLAILGAAIIFLSIIQLASGIINARRTAAA